MFKLVNRRKHTNHISHFSQFGFGRNLPRRDGSGSARHFPIAETYLEVSFGTQTLTKVTKREVWNRQKAETTFRTFLSFVLTGISREETMMHDCFGQWMRHCFPTCHSETQLCFVHLGKALGETSGVFRNIGPAATQGARWVRVHDAAEFASLRAKWDPSHWRTQQTLQEPIACISHKHTNNIFEPEPNKGWCTLEQFIEEVAVTRA